MQRIVFVHFRENLAWHTEDHWYKINTAVQNKRQLMLWLEANTTGTVVIHGGAQDPSASSIQWGKSLTGDFENYDFWFQEDRDAMTFKLAWT